MLFMKNNRLRQSIHSDAHRALRDFLTKQRYKLKLTQRDLAEKMNINHSLIGKIETGDRRLDIVELLEYAHALEIDTMDIINIIQKTQNYPPRFTERIIGWHRQYNTFTTFLFQQIVKNFGKYANE